MNIEKLQAVTHIVTHRDCADGIASAMILKDCLPMARVTFLHHGSPEHEALPSEPGMLFCDFVPPRSRLDRFVADGAIVLDHHRHSEDVVRAFGEHGVFADEDEEPGVSGATLAAREVWGPLNQRVFTENRLTVSKFATLAGVRDTWQKSDKRWEAACAQAEALRFWPTEMLVGAPVAFWDERLRIGDVLFQKKLAVAREIADSAHRFTSRRGTSIAMFPTIDSSDVAEQLGYSADVAVGFGYKTRADGSVVMIFSLRSRREYDVGALCKAHGGGGHTRAAGFSIDMEPTAQNPIHLFKVMLDTYEGRLP